MISRLSLHNNISRLAWIYNNRINTHQRNEIFARSHHINRFKMIFFIVITLGAGGFLKREKKPEIKKYLKSIYFLLVIIALLGSVLVLFL